MSSLRTKPQPRALRRADEGHTNPYTTNRTHRLRATPLLADADIEMTRTIPRDIFLAPKVTDEVEAKVDKGKGKDDDAENHHNPKPKKSTKRRLTRRERNANRQSAHAHCIFEARELGLINDDDPDCPLSSRTPLGTLTFYVNREKERRKRDQRPLAPGAALPPPIIQYIPGSVEHTNAMAASAKGKKSKAGDGGSGDDTDICGEKDDPEDEEIDAPQHPPNWKGKGRAIDMDMNVSMGSLNDALPSVAPPHTIQDIPCSPQKLKSSPFWANEQVIARAQQIDYGSVASTSKPQPPPTPLITRSMNTSASPSTRTTTATTAPLSATHRFRTTQLEQPYQGPLLSRIQPQPRLVHSQPTSTLQVPTSSRAEANDSDGTSSTSASAIHCAQPIAERQTSGTAHGDTSKLSGGVEEGFPLVNATAGRCEQGVEVGQPGVIPAGSFVGSWTNRSGGGTSENFFNAPPFDTARSTNAPAPAPEGVESQMQEASCTFTPPLPLQTDQGQAWTKGPAPLIQQDQQQQHQLNGHISQNNGLVPSSLPVNVQASWTDNSTYNGFAPLPSTEASNQAATPTPAQAQFNATVPLPAAPAPLSLMSAMSWTETTEGSNWQWGQQEQEGLAWAQAQAQAQGAFAPWVASTSGWGSGAAQYQPYQTVLPPYTRPAPTECANNFWTRLVCEQFGEGTQEVVMSTAFAGTPRAELESERKEDEPIPEQLEGQSSWWGAVSTKEKESASGLTRVTPTQENRKRRVRERAGVMHRPMGRDAEEARMNKAEIAKRVRYYLPGDEKYPQRQSWCVSDSRESLATDQKQGWLASPEQQSFNAEFEEEQEDGWVNPAWLREGEVGDIDRSPFTQLVDLKTPWKVIKGLVKRAKKALPTRTKDSLEYHSLGMAPSRRHYPISEEEQDVQMNDDRHAVLKEMVAADILKEMGFDLPPMDMDLLIDDDDEAEGFGIKDLGCDEDLAVLLQ